MHETILFVPERHVDEIIYDVVVVDNLFRSLDLTTSISRSIGDVTVVTMQKDERRRKISENIFAILN